jgi:hypothetical protein
LAIHRSLRASLTAALSLVVLLGTRTAGAQVNTDPLRPGPLRAGWVGNLDGTIALLSGNTELLDVGLGGRVSYQTLYPTPSGPEGAEPPPFLRERVSLIGSARFTARGGQEIVNQGLLHARWTRYWHPRVGTNLFAQHQYNEFQRLRIRSLWGASLALQIVHARAVNLSAGTGYMLEYNRIAVLPGAPDAQQTLEHRWSTFVGLRLAPVGDMLFIQSATYAQPRFDELSDLRFLEELEILAKVTDRFSMGLLGSVLVDTAPPTGVKEMDLRFSSLVRVSY